MDRAIWKLITRTIRAADRVVPRTGRRPKYSDAQIVKMHFHSVAHDKPRSWACDRKHDVGGFYRPRTLPSISQFCRRLKSPRVQALIDQVNARLGCGDQPLDILSVDGKALAISDYSADPDAKDGRGCGRFQRGYRLHALVADDNRILRFAVHPMNVAEQTVAYDLLGEVGPSLLVLGDSNYDSARLYQRCEDQGSMLLTPLKGRSRSPEHLARMPQSRRDVLELWDHHDGIARSLLRQRDRIERVFSALCGSGDGLKNLPQWVRRLQRVGSWVAGKIALYNARVALRPPAA